MDVTPILASQSCTVEWNGVEVGSMQGILIQSLYNVNRVTNLWASKDQAFVSGTPQYNITATKAFIDLSTFFGGIKAITQLKNDYVGVQQSVNNGTRGVLLEDVAKMVGSLGNVVSQLFTGATPADKFLNKIYFDIKIRTPSFNGFTIGEVGQNNIWTLQECKLVARQITLDVTSIVILEKIDVFAKTLTDVFLNNNSF